MKDSLLKYLLIVSLLLNSSFLGAAAYSYYHQNPSGTPPFGYGPPGRVPAGSSTQPHLFEALSLKPEQRMLFEQKAPLFHKALEEKKEKVDQLRRSLFELMRTEHPDSKAIEATIGEINGVQEDMQKLVATHMLQFKSMLDKDQQKRFFDLIERVMTRGKRSSALDP
jgi:Spy/CpxP family protein refolding chaperone